MTRETTVRGHQVGTAGGTAQLRHDRYGSQI